MEIVWSFRQDLYIVNLRFLHHQQSMFAKELVQYTIMLQVSTKYAQKGM